MKRILLATLSAAAVFSCQAALSVKVVPETERYSIAATRAASTEKLDFPKNLGCFFDAGNIVGEPANYYTIFSTSSDAQYHPSSASVTCEEGWMMYISFMGTLSSPTALPEGTYTVADKAAFNTYESAYSYISKYENGKVVKEVFLDQPVVVTKTDNVYTIRTEVVDTDVTYDVTYEGLLPFEDVASGSAVYPQIKQNLDLNFTGAKAVYQGNSFNSNTGAIYVDLYTNAYNPETGGMTEDGYSVNMCLFNKLFSDSKEAKPIAGTYTAARNSARGTFYPGLEIDYLGITVVFGSYVAQREESFGEYQYGYVADGTVEIEEVDGGYKVTVDVVTNLGYYVKGTYTGAIKTDDVSDDSGWGSTVSELEDDVDLDLSHIPAASVYNLGIANAKNDQQVRILKAVLTIDDERAKLMEGDDTMDLEFLLPLGTPEIEDGTYGIIEKHPYYEWEQAYYYEPYMMETGYYNKSGGLIGTKYERYEAGRYWITEYWAPASTGQIRVSTNADNTKTVEIDVYCDRAFNIKGTWTGPFNLLYNPNDISGVAGIENAAEQVQLVSANSETLIFSGVTPEMEISLYDMKGANVLNAKGVNELNIAQLPAGVYLARVGAKTFKAVK